MVRKPRVRIATWNILHGLDLRTGRVDLPGIAAVLAELDADVIALQEVDRHLGRSGEADQTAVLADLLGMHGVFGPALLGDPDTAWSAVGTPDPGGRAYGVAILSCLPLEGSASAALPGGGAGTRSPRASLGNPGWDGEPRVALSARVATPQGSFTLTSTHLSYLPWRAVAQLRAIAAATSGRGAAVLAGDCNLPVWAVGRTLGHRWEHGGGEPTYPARSPRVQVDQIAATGGIALDSARVHPETPGDHLPLVVDAALPASA